MTEETKVLEIREGDVITIHINDERWRFIVKFGKDENDRTTIEGIGLANTDTLRLEHGKKVI